MGCLTVDDVINLEHCCLPTTKLGGHIVSGHVDDMEQFCLLILMVNGLY